MDLLNFLNLFNFGLHEYVLHLNRNYIYDNLKRDPYRMATVLSTREKNSRQVVGFLDLPREIRQMIYKHIITEPALIIHYPHLAYQTPGTYHEYVSDDESDDSSIDPAKEEDER